MMAVAAQTMATAVATPRVHQTTQTVTGRPAALPALTGLRFFAALVVFTTHFGAAILSGTSAPVRALASSGYAGVTLFFLLSGFLLAHAYLDEAGRLRTPRHTFYVARVGRIYPVYLLALAIAAVPLAWGAGAAVRLPAHTVMAVLTLTQSWSPHTALAWNGPAYSLSEEAFFYLTFPILAPLLCARVRARRALLLVAAGLLLCLLGPALAYCLVRPDGPSYAWNSPLVLALDTNPLAGLPLFLLGIVLARLRPAAGVPPSLWPPPGRRLLGRLSAPAGAACLLVLLAWPPSVPFPLLVHGLAVPACALFLYVLAQAPAHRGLGRVLGCGALVRLGQASYALYLLQMPLWPLFVRLLGAGAGARATEGAAQSSPAAVVAYLLLLVAASLLVHALVEEPARRLLRVWLGPHAAAGQTPHAARRTR